MTISMIRPGLPAAGSFVQCNSIKPPKWWTDINDMGTYVGFNCALTVGKKYEVLGHDELPRGWLAQGFGGYKLLLIEDDDGYVIGFDPERFR